MYGSVSELADVVERVWMGELGRKFLTDSMEATGEHGELRANLANFSLIRSFSDKQNHERALLSGKLPY